MLSLLRNFLSWVCVWQIISGQPRLQRHSWCIEIWGLLTYKKGEPGNPENFRLITLQPVLSKVFTSIIRNRLFNFAYFKKQIHWNESSKRFLGENIRLYQTQGMFIAYHKQCKIETKRLCCYSVRLKERFWRGKP